MSADVIIVNYMSARVLATSLPELRAFVGDDAGFIFSDNSPGDGGVELMKAFAPAAKVISNEGNVGFAAAVNRAVLASDADLILLANPDIGTIRGTLDSVLRPFEEDPRVAAVGVDLVDHDGGAQPGWTFCPTPWDVLAYSTPLWRLVPAGRGGDRKGRISRGSGIRVPALCGAFLLVRRSALLDVGPFDEQFFLYYEETDWLLRAADRGWKILRTPEVRVVHQACSCDGGSPGTMRDELLLESQQRYLRKHYGAGPELIVRIGCLASAGAGLIRAVVRRQTRTREMQLALARIRVLTTSRARRP